MLHLFCANLMGPLLHVVSAESFIWLRVNAGESWILNFLPHVSHPPGIFHAAFLYKRIVWTSIIVWVGTRFHIPTHVKMHVLFSLEYHNKMPQTGWLKQQKFVSYSSGGWKSKIKVPANSVSAEGSPRGLQMANSLYVLTWPFFGDCIQREKA